METSAIVLNEYQMFQYVQMVACTKEPWIYQPAKVMFNVRASCTRNQFLLLFCIGERGYHIPSVEQIPFALKFKQVNSSISC